MVPTGRTAGAARNRPPMPSVLTREICESPPPYQATDIPFGSAIRWYRLSLQGVSLAIIQGKVLFQWMRSQ